MARRWVILVAGGVGSRMQSDVPKQFRLLEGRPVWAWALAPFLDEAFAPVLITHPDHRRTVMETARRLFPKNKILWAPAGPERFFSVKSGVDFLADRADGTDVVAIHDAARPFVDRPLICRGWETVQQAGTAVPVIPPYDAVRIRQLDSWKPFPRRHLLMIQTPQIFRYDWLSAAYEQPYREDFTDDAAVVESAMFPIAFYEGSRFNFKLTTAPDWQLARAWAGCGRREE